MSWDETDPPVDQAELAVARALFRQMAQRDPRLAAMMWLEDGVAHYREGGYEPALHAARAAVDLLRGQPGAEAEALLASALNLLAESQKFLGRDEEALASYDEALRVLQASGGNGQSGVLSNRGSLLLRLGRTAEAIKSQELALKLDIAAHDPVGEAYSHHNLAGALAGVGRQEEALEHARRAASIREARADSRGVYESLLLCSSLLRELGRAKEAEACLERAVALGPRLRDPFLLRLAYREQLELLAGTSDTAKYLSTMETLFNLLEKYRATLRDWNRLDEFDDRYNRHYESSIRHLLQFGMFDRALVLIERTRARALQAHLGRRAGVPDPDNGPPTTEFDPCAIRSCLAADEVLLEFWIDAGKRYAFLFNHDDGPVVSVTEGGITDSVQAILQLMEPGPLPEDGNRGFNDDVVGPIARYLGTGARIYLVPHGQQCYFPPACFRYGGDRVYLCENNEIVVLPSASILPAFKALPHVETTECLVVGDPDGSLPFARREGEEVARLVGCEPMLGSDATAERLCARLENSEFNVIHFACHYSTDDRQPGLVMAGGQLVSPGMLIETGMRANVVSLAACWSGLVEFSAWNHFSGLVRAALLAGARCVVSSVAPVPDEASHLLFRRFYEGILRRGESPSYALARAQCAVRESPRFAAPKYWSGFYVTGKAD